jgi:riboflavin biosynthesis pyrimidine reductase
MPTVCEGGSTIIKQAWLHLGIDEIKVMMKPAAWSKNLLPQTRTTGEHAHKQKTEELKLSRVGG